MLDNIRRTADSFMMRILFAMIVFAFIGWEMKGLLKPSNPDIVTFSSAENITRDDFLRAKSLEIHALQKQMGTIFSEEELRGINIDGRILTGLIHNNIIDYLVNYYEFDISNEMVKELIKESPMFKNEYGTFDVRIFKNYFQNSYVAEEKFLSDFKQKALRNFLIGTFAKGLHVPKLMTDNIINYLSEKRGIALLKLDSTHKPGVAIPVPTDDQLQEFYKKNPKMFTIPETRSFFFIKISEKNLSQQVHIAEDEVLQFYNDNQDEFKDKSLESVYQQIYDLLEKQKIEGLNMKLAKKLEDDVASGATLVEIAEKYKLPLQSVEYISYNDLQEHAIMSESADSVFELSEGEVSYPSESSDGTYLTLVELKAIKPSKVPELPTIRKEVHAAWTKEHLAAHNLQSMKNLAAEYTPTKWRAAKLRTMGIKLSNKTYTRSAIGSDGNVNQEELSPEMLSLIFRTEPGSNTPVFQLGDTICFAHIQSVGIDKKMEKEMSSSSVDTINDTIKNSMLEELINYATKRNSMKIHYSDNIFKKHDTM